MSLEDMRYEALRAVRRWREACFQELLDGGSNHKCTEAYVKLGEVEEAMAKIWVRGMLG